MFPFLNQASVSPITEKNVKYLYKIKLNKAVVVSAKVYVVTTNGQRDESKV